MSATLEYASTHYPEMLDVPSNHPPASEEDIRMFKEISRELAQRICQTLAGKKTTAPTKKKVAKKTLSIDAGRMF